MAKIKITDYIATLRSLIDTKDERQLQENFAGFLQLLRTNRQLGLIDQILDGLAIKLNQEQGRLTALIRSQEKLKSTDLAQIEKFLCVQFGVKEIAWRQEQNLSNPGIIIEAGGKKFDWSLDQQLEKFRQSIKLA